MDGSKDTIEISVILLDHSEIIFVVSKRDRGQVLLDAVFKKLRCQEPKYFGLQFPQNVPDAMKWLDPTKSIRKQFKRGYPLILYYRIKYYISDLSRMKDHSTRYQLFLQIKLEILEQRLSCPANKAALLASYAVQSAFGDFDPGSHQGRYLKKFKFLPNQTQDFENELQKLHKKHRGLTPGQAEFLFLQEAKKLPTYGVDLHYGKLTNGQDIKVGVATDGIGIFKKGKVWKQYDWSKIIKISFKRKLFYIQLQREEGKDDSLLTEFSMDNYRACKRLWKNCVDCHSFHRQDREKVLGPSKKQGIIPTKNGKPVFGLFNLGGKNNRAKHDSMDKAMLNFREPQKSTSTKMLNTSVFSKDKDSFFDLDKKESRRLSAPPSVTLAVLPPDQHDQIPMNNSQHDLTDAVRTEHVRHHKEVEPDPYPLSDFSPQESYYDCPFQPTQQETISNNSAPEPYILPGDMGLIRIKPDIEGRFGFNIKGGSDLNLPITISKIAPHSPADTCNPPLNVGDEIVQINGRDVNLLTHEQAVNFIRATREKFSGELVLLVRPLVTFQGVNDMEPQGDVQQPAEMESADDEEYQETLESSMKLLDHLVATGKEMMLFDKLYRRKTGLAMNDARLAANVPRNRYRDISPYDATRVRLTSWETDYINGSHIIIKINNTDIINHYIACQGPLPLTSGDFWAMVWQQGATLIVMVTTIVERGMMKCHQYWPDASMTKQFGNLTVTSVSERKSNCFVFREFDLSVAGDESSAPRRVSHIQYVAWPDHGVPDDSSDFLDFITCVRQKRVGMTVPTVVHCSAGIGRTGVMIAMETAMCLIEAGQPVYPLQITRDMRDQRAMMIQTAAQFRFVCEAILRVFYGSQQELSDEKYEESVQRVE